MTVVLAFSAHLDDAVFSAGGTLARAARERAHVIVATLFAGNVTRPQGFPLQCQLDKGLPPDIDYMALRREEDRAACAIIGAEAWHCALLEAPHRGYGDAAALFMPPHESGEAEGLVETIQYVVSAARPDVIWAPRAVGSHVDHVLLHRALRSRQEARRALWYTDFPYAGKPCAPDLETPKLGDVAWASVDLSSSLRDMKADACAAYASQLGYQFGGAAAMRRVVSSQQSEVFAFAAR